MHEEEKKEEEEHEEEKKGAEPEQKDQDDYNGQLCDDAYENIEIALQLVDNFLSQGDEALREERQAVVQNLLIDLNNRNAELFQFKE